MSVRDHDYVLGEFVWVGYDYLGEIVWPDYRGWNEGILDIAGFPKMEYWLRKSYWTADPGVHVGVQRSEGRDFDWSPRDVVDHWNWAGKDTVSVWVYTNCDEVELRVGRKSMGKKEVDPDLYSVEWSVPYRAGSVTAIGYRDGKKVTEHTLQTAGEPYALEVSRIYRYGDVVRAELQVVDEKGDRVPDSEVEVSVSGSARAELWASTTETSTIHRARNIRRKSGARVTRDVW